jgi:Ni2+-binding GTPase involved in maturation of urease and hydrogenase
MMVHLVGGFLGSGKTTAIVRASALLIERGVSVAVVTNDQGKNLVDTAFVRASGIPASEVTGGCFCCNFSNFERMLAELEQKTSPRVVFAEPVGSCTDIVATVMRPLGQRRDGQMGSLSVMTDIRLIRLWLAGRPLPFCKDIQYIFELQLEEASVIVLNKADLLQAEDAQVAWNKAQDRFREKKVILQNSLSAGSVEGWLAVLEGEQPLAKSARVDYDRYGTGEMRLAWYDASIGVDLPPSMARETVGRIMMELKRAAHGKKQILGHLKLLVRHRDGLFKCSMTAGDDRPPAIPDMWGGHLDIIINVRTEGGAERLRSSMREALASALKGEGITWRVGEERAFHPSRPINPRGDEDRAKG